MSSERFERRVRELQAEPVPLPGSGGTPKRHNRLFEAAREDVSLAKIAEAQWDAVSILAEAGRDPVPGALYGVWASEVPGRSIAAQDGRLSGTKSFASGIGLVDRALVTLGPDDGRLIDLDLHQHGVTSDLSSWKTEAFRLTRTGEIHLEQVRFRTEDVVGEPGFYTARPGFWHGACGPAACWAGAAAGLLDYAQKSRRSDPHTLAHVGAMHANVWAMETALQGAGHEIDRAPKDIGAAHQRALTLRHLVEHLATDTLRRFARAFGPYPLAIEADTVQRYHETDLFLRQCHAERDLEALGQLLRSASA